MIHSLLLNLSLLVTTSQGTLTDAFKASTIDSYVKELHKTYVQPKVAKNIEASLRRWSQTDDYRKTTDGNQFAKKINELMKKEVTDGHLWIRYSQEVLPAREKPAQPSKEELAQEKRDAIKSNAGFVRAERLSGNVGYLKINQFHPLPDSRRPMEAAMNFLASTDALIVDLRDHIGGHSETCDHFASYFFPAGKPTKIYTLYDRKLNKSIDVYTESKTFGPRYTKPTYVLISKNTGSASESVAYNLKAFKRATLVGKSTYGIANMGEFVRVNDHFMSLIPFAQSTSPITGTNWEATGVLPDIDVPAAEALTRAHEEALKAIKSAKAKANL